MQCCTSLQSVLSHHNVYKPQWRNNSYHDRIIDHHVFIKNTHRFATISRDTRDLLTLTRCFVCEKSLRTSTSSLAKMAPLMRSLDPRLREAKRPSVRRRIGHVTCANCGRVYVSKSVWMRASMGACHPLQCGIPQFILTMKWEELLYVKSKRKDLGVIMNPDVKASGQCRFAASKEP